MTDEATPPAAPGTPPPAPAAGTPAPTAPAPDLTALQAAIDQANASGKTAAESDVLKALGFEKVDDAKAFIEAKRAEDDAKLTETDKAKNDAARAQAEATQAKAQLATFQAEQRVERALLAAGADVTDADGNLDADKLDMVRRLVEVDVNADATAVATAVQSVKDKFSALFTAKTTPGPRSGVTSGQRPPVPEPTGNDAMKRGADMWAQRKAAQQASKAS